jgi:hypothetical protein
VPSAYGKSRNLTCPGCGMPYDYHAQEQPHGFTVGMTFATARRDIIAIGTDRKTGKTKYGRRHGTLGFLHELKMLAWRAHVDQCVAAFDAAVEAGADPESLLEFNLAALKASRPPVSRKRKMAEPKRRAA